MKLPKLTAPDETRNMIDTFLGYNHNLKARDGEFFQMENMTGSFYPMLAPRGKRGDTGVTGVTGIIGKDALCYVKGTKLYMNGYDYELGLSNTEKTLVGMGAYILIFPDKKWFDTATGEHGSMENTKTVQSATYTMCTVEGTAYGNVTVSPTKPENPANGAYWLDTSGAVHVLKVYSTSTGLWAEISTTYVKIQAAGIGVGFSQYDGVTMTGVQPAQLSNLNGNASILYGCDTDYIVVAGILDQSVTQSTPLTVARRVPDMDYVTESGNRLWGCKYGTVQGKPVNEIYACKLGDFKNWNCFMGISTDSYAVTVGTDGQFTGAVTYLGYPMFFKEDCYHKLYGNQPSSFQVQTTSCRGVSKGCSKSLAIVGETLFYKSIDGVCAYDGSLPAKVDTALGTDNYTEAVAGALGSKYYVSMKKGSEWHLFTYDTRLGFWHREDNTRVKAFCSCTVLTDSGYADELYFIDSENKLLTVCGTGTGYAEESVSWMAETAVMGLSHPDRKTPGRMTVRMLLYPGSTVKLDILYDNSGRWENLFTMKGRELKSFTVPVRPRRCDTFKLRFRGEGDCRILSLALITERGSDRR